MVTVEMDILGTPSSVLGAAEKVDAIAFTLGGALCGRSDQRVQDCSHESYWISIRNGSGWATLAARLLASGGLAGLCPRSLPLCATPRSPVGAGIRSCPAPPARSPRL